MTCSCWERATHLDEIQSGLSRRLDQKHSYVCLRSLNAAVEHAEEHGRIITKVHHESLLFLHLLPEGCWVDSVCVVKKQVAFAGQLYLCSKSVSVSSCSENAMWLMSQVLVNAWEQKRRKRKDYTLRRQLNKKPHHSPIRPVNEEGSEVKI